jgi:hypothetical protein
MKITRRQVFGALAGTGIGLAGPAIARAAAAANSRLYFSQMQVREIAWGLVLGIGREAFGSLQALGEANVRRFIENFDLDRIRARLRTLREPIDVEFDSLKLTIGGAEQHDKLTALIAAIHAIAERDVDFQLNAEEAKALLETVRTVRENVSGRLDAGLALELSYNVRYKRAYFHVANYARRGQVRMDLSLLQPVRNFNGAHFHADLSQCGTGTRVYTSLWADVCIGRREGPIVRRIAEREIRCREAAFLAEIEHEVRALVTGMGQSRLNLMMPELIRRIADGGA